MLQIFTPQYKLPLFNGLIDIHNHILPGIDDGSKTPETSLQMLKQLEALGFKGTIPTPHIFIELYPNTRKSIQKSYDRLIDEIDEKNEGHLKSFITHHNGFAAEYMIDENFLRLAKEESLFLTLKDQFILIEIPAAGQVPMLHEACFWLCTHGYQPILAHPERYFSITHTNEYQALKDRGMTFQLNALSLLGQYGPLAKEKAFKLLKQGMYDWIGTDAHTSGQLKLLHHLKLSKREGLQWEALVDHQKNSFT